jgi:thiamine pyrophosphokinase
MELRGLTDRGEVRGSVLVLQGARREELESSCDLAAMMSDRCLLVAVDGGLTTCRAARRRPDLFVGDGDSASDIPRDIPSIVFPADKDFSDLAGALEELRKRRTHVVTVAGLLGGRVDHEWANLLELGGRARAFAGLLAPTERGTILVTRHGCKAATVRGRTVSLFAMGAGATVTLTGTRWVLQRERFPPGSRGLSNETGTELDLIVHSGAVALVFLPGRVQSASSPRA